jgi:C4-dicarboxylate-binding protein DctP
MMQARVRAALLVGLFCGIVGCGGSGAPASGAAPAAAAPYVIKFPHVVALATPKGQMAQRFKELV